MLVTEQDHTVFGGLTNLLELNRFLVQLDPNDLSSTAPLPLDPSDL